MVGRSGSNHNIQWSDLHHHKIKRLVTFVKFTCHLNRDSQSRTEVIITATKLRACSSRSKMFCNPKIALWPLFQKENMSMRLILSRKNSRRLTASLWSFIFFGWSKRIEAADARFGWHLDNLMSQMWWRKDKEHLTEHYLGPYDGLDCIWPLSFSLAISFGDPTIYILLFKGSSIMYWLIPLNTQTKPLQDYLLPSVFVRSIVCFMRRGFFH